MRDDAIPPNLGQAPGAYDQKFFWTAFRALEVFQTKFLSRGPIRVSDLDADTISIGGQPVAAASWTPLISFGGANAGLTYGTRIGRHVRIGPIVFIGFDVTLTAKGTSTGAAAVSGFPFAVNASMYGGGTITWWSGMAGLTGMPSLLATPAGTAAGIVQFGATAAVQVTDANFTNTSRIIGNGWYIT